MAKGSVGTVQSEPSRAVSHRVEQVWRVRDASRSDLDALLALESGFPGDRLSRRQMRWHLASPRARFGVLADASDAVFGYAMVLIHAQRADARLYSIVVDPVVRGRGAGRTLIDWALRHAAALGARGLALEVRADNEAARRLYRAAGFQDLGLKPQYYEDGEDARRLWHAIGSTASAWTRP